MYKRQIQDYEKKNSALSDDLETVHEHDLLSRLIEISKSKQKPLVVKDENKKSVGVITQSDLLRAVVEGGDGE